jgi:hypothetical protein
MNTIPKDLMKTKLTLYHGSNCNFHTIDLSKTKDKRDFGKGFYMTSGSTRFRHDSRNFSI